MKKAKTTPMKFNLRKAVMQRAKAKGDDVPSSLIVEPHPFKKEFYWCAVEDCQSLFHSKFKTLKNADSAGWRFILHQRAHVAICPSCAKNMKFEKPAEGTDG